MHVLVLNAGSTSLKLDVFDMPAERPLATGEAHGLGTARAAAKLERLDRDDLAPLDHEGGLADHSAALDVLLGPLMAANGLGRDIVLGAVGHRVVHGGERLHPATVVDDRVERAIEELSSFAPLHNPPNLAGIRAVRARLPDLPQVAVLDTGFHRTMPPEAFLYGLPYELYQQHRVRRYGFHGISHGYVATGAARLLGRPLEELKLVTCHLGGGCSVCAVDGGRSIDTSMGMTPLEGLLMATRTGDLDPAVVLLLGERLGLSGAEIDDLLNRRSGLAGVSGLSRDMRTLLAHADNGHERSELAIAMFSRRVTKYIGAYAALMGGVDAVVFTGGIGEHAATVRARVLAPLAFLGLELDDERNAGDDGRPRVVSAPTSRVAAIVVPTDEELEIARRTVGALEGMGADQ